MALIWEAGDVKAAVSLTLLLLALVAGSCGYSTTTGRVDDVNGDVVCIQPLDGSGAECLTAGESSSSAAAIVGHPASWYRSGMCVQLKMVSDGPWAVVGDETACPTTTAPPATR